jgi:hypothetical protein
MSRISGSPIGDAMGTSRLHQEIFRTNFAGSTSMHGTSLKAGEPFVVPQRAYFVLNDNRNELMDSRILGALPQTRVFGRPVLAYSAVSSPWSWPRLIR